MRKSVARSARPADVATLYDYFGEYGLDRQSDDFALGTAGTGVQARVRDVLQKVETGLNGENHERGAGPSQSGVHRQVDGDGLTREVIL